MWMRKWGLAICIIPLRLFSFTPQIDANKWEDWENVDLTNSTGSYNLPYDACKKLWITHDDTCIYIGWEFGGDPWDDGLSSHWMFAIDVNGTASGNGTDPWCSTTEVGWQNKPDFWITAWISYGNDAFGGISLKKWTGTIWRDVGGLRHAESVSNGWAEIGILMDTLGITFGDSIFIVCYFRPAENKPGISDANPFDDTCSDYADNSAYITQGFWYHIKDTINGPLIDGYIYRAKHDWAKVDSICSNSHSGTGIFAYDSLYNLYVTWDTVNLYIGIDAFLTTDHNNFCLIYIDVDFKQWDSLGFNDNADLCDETGSLDASITGFKPSICPVKGFYVDFVLGCKNAGDCDGVNDTCGLRKLDNAFPMNDFGWIACKVRARGGGDLEAEIPWSSLYPDVSNIVKENAKIGLFVIIKDASGDAISDATLPEEVFPTTMNSIVMIEIDKDGDGIPDMPPKAGENSKILVRDAGDSSTYDVPEIDGAIFFVSSDDWKRGALPLCNLIPTNWTGDKLDSLFVTWDLHDLFIGIKGSLTSVNNNALLIYIDKDFQNDKNGAGFDGKGDVSDNVGRLDDAITGALPDTVLVPGFCADFVCGVINAGDVGYYSLSDTVGLRNIENPADFAWIDLCEVEGTPDGDVEIKINWKSLYGRLGRVDTGAILALFCVIKNSTGDFISNQCLPADSTLGIINAVFWIQVDADSDGIPDTGVTSFKGYHVWYGGISQNYTDNANWSFCTKPDSQSIVLIQPYCSNYPVVNERSFCGDLKLLPVLTNSPESSRITVNLSETLYVYGNWDDREGVFRGSHGVITLCGSKASAISSGIQNEFPELIVEKTSSSVSLLTDLTVGSKIYIKSGTLFTNSQKLIAKNNVYVAGVFYLNEGSELQIADNETLTVLPSGEIKLIGSDIDSVKITGYSGGFYNFFVNGKIDARYYIFENFGVHGIRINTGAQIQLYELITNTYFAMPYGVFRKGAPACTMLVVDSTGTTTSGDTLYFQYIKFDSSLTYGEGYNVGKPNTKSHYLCFFGQSGDFWGELFDADPGDAKQGEGFIIWNPQPLGMQEKVRNTITKIYPNPVIDRIIIRNGGEVIKIYDLTGRIILDIRGKREIDIRNLKAGMYFIKIDGRTYKFIKIK